MAKGKKTCLKCKKEIGARALKCPCGYVFERKLKAIEEVTTRTVINNAKVIVESGKTIRKTSPKQHAERIISYGKYRATTLYNLNRIKTRWQHVDWDYVKEKFKL